MKTKSTPRLKDVLSHTENPRLFRAVIKQLGGWDDNTVSALRDIARHGVGGGFNGFSYYADTVSFFRRHRSAILAAVETFAEGLGEDAVTMVAGFRCLNGDYSTRDVARVLYGRWEGDLNGRLLDYSGARTQIANALAWFAAEEAARLFEYFEEMKDC